MEASSQALEKVRLHGVIAVDGLARPARMPFATLGRLTMVIATASLWMMAIGSVLSAHVSSVGSAAGRGLTGWGAGAQGVQRGLEPSRRAVGRTSM